MYIWILMLRLLDTSGHPYVASWGIETFSSGADCVRRMNSQNHLYDLPPPSEANVWTGFICERSTLVGASK